MARKASPLILNSTFSTPKICLPSETERRFYPLTNIAYLKGDGSSTCFQLFDPQTGKLTGQKVTGYGLSYYKNLCDFYFGRANQQFIVNLNSLKEISGNRYIHLHCENQPVICITKTFAEEFHRRLMDR